MSVNVLRACAQGINAILFFAPIIFKSLGNGQYLSLVGAVAVRHPFLSLLLPWACKADTHDHAPGLLYLEMCMSRRSCAEGNAQRLSSCFHAVEGVSSMQLRWELKRLVIPAHRGLGHADWRSHGGRDAGRNRHCRSEWAAQTADRWRHPDVSHRGQRSP